MQAKTVLSRNGFIAGCVNPNAVEWAAGTWYRLHCFHGSAMPFVALSAVEPELKIAVFSPV
jgi:hypothetical protein